MRWIDDNNVLCKFVDGNNTQKVRFKQLDINTGSFVDLSEVTFEADISENYQRDNPHIVKDNFYYISVGNSSGKNEIRAYDVRTGKFELIVTTNNISIYPIGIYTKK